MANKLISEMGLPTSIANIFAARNVTTAKALSLMEQRIQNEYMAGHLPTRLKGLGEALGGGIPFGVLTELVGPPGIGKTQVSQYTGRIHLYSCIPGIDSRRRPLFENFRPEELYPLNPNGAYNIKKTTVVAMKDNPTYRDAFLAFVKEWNNLRPIQQKKLLQKPLQLPLTVELCYLSEGINHTSRGLLKGGTKRRTTPLDDVSYPLPSNAVWKKIYLCSGYGKRVKEHTQGWTLMDEPLCKLCQTPCKNSNSKTPDFFEDLFCTLGCYEEYRIRTSNRSLHQGLFQIEHGVCTSCHLDCHKLVQFIKPLSLTRRREYIEKVAPRLAVRKILLDKLVSDPTEGNAWHAGHIIPVYRGGGECSLENMRTLCVACHSDVTAAQCAERRSIRIKAKKQLKVIMKSLKDDEKMKHTHANSKDFSKGIHLEELNVLLKQTVMDFICKKGIGFIRIDGNMLARDRQSTVLSFRSSTEVKIAIIGITAAGVGLDFSSAQNVVFLELPQSPSIMLQAEDRAHRRGQTNAVNIYIFFVPRILWTSHIGKI